MTRIALMTALALAAVPVACAHQGAAPAQVETAAKDAAAAAKPAVEIKSTDLGNGIYMLEGQGGNIGVLTGPDGTFVIDSQFANISAENLAKIEEIAGEGLRFLVNTHWHGDHTGGNADFNTAGATIIAHKNVRGRLSNDQSLSRFGKTTEIDAAPEAAWPVITFPDDMSLHLNGQSIDLAHVPRAHTDGDTIVFFREANVVHMGDVMFSGRFPFIDGGSGGSVTGYIAALEKAYKRTNERTTVIPGHGPLSKRSDILALMNMLKETSAKMRPIVASGKTLEEVQAMNPLADWSDEWSWQFITTERFTAGLYGDLKANMPKATD